MISPRRESIIDFRQLSVRATGTHLYIKWTGDSNKPFHLGDLLYRNGKLVYDNGALTIVAQKVSCRYLHGAHRKLLTAKELQNLRKRYTIDNRYVSESKITWIIRKIFRTKFCLYNIEEGWYYSPEGEANDRILFTPPYIIEEI